MSDNKIIGGDGRLKKSDAPEVHGDRSDADASREMTDGTALSMDERRQLMRSEWVQDILPTPPVVPGWHFCWLSTTNSTDPIYRRMQKGYEPVKVSEIPGFRQYRITEGEFEGCIACNEMLLFKLPEELYQEAMRYFHYELPQAEEEMIQANAEKIANDIDKNGRKLVELEGFDDLVRRVQPPTFQ